MLQPEPGSRTTPGTSPAAMRSMASARAVRGEQAPAAACRRLQHQGIDPKRHGDALDDGLARSAEVIEDPDRRTVLAAAEPDQEVLGVGAPVAEATSLALGGLERALHLRRDAEALPAALAAASDHLLDAAEHGRARDPDVGEHVRRKPVALSEEAQQHVLRAE